jgi:hypothetical protein
MAEFRDIEVDEMSSTRRVHVLQIYTSGAAKAMELVGGGELLSAYLKDLLHLIERYLLMDGVSYVGLVRNLRQTEMAPGIDGPSREFASTALRMLGEK